MHHLGSPHLRPKGRYFTICEGALETDCREDAKDEHIAGEPVSDTPGKTEPEREALEMAETRAFV